MQLQHIFSYLQVICGDPLQLVKFLSHCELCDAVAHKTFIYLVV